MTQAHARTVGSNAGNVPVNSGISRLGHGFSRYWPYYVMLAPGVIYFLVYHYLPMWEAKLAFEDYRIFGANLWVGFKHFQTIFASPVFYQVLWNTLIISAMKMVFVFPIPIIVSLMLNEVRSGPLRKTVQSAIYLPHFLSWVVIASIFIAVLSPSEGAVSAIMQWFGLRPVNFMTDSNAIRWVLVLTENWRSAGWDSLLYLAAILAIDPALYESAEMDGANRWQKIWYVTIPGIVPTIATLFILNMGMFLNAGFDQVFNLSNDAVRSQIDIIDTYVYRIGLQTGEYSLATAVGLFKGLIGMLMILAAHYGAKALTGKGVW